MTTERSKRSASRRATVVLPAPGIPLMSQTSAAGGTAGHAFAVGGSRSDVVMWAGRSGGGVAGYLPPRMAS
jgi:hypothetical protein